MNTTDSVASHITQPEPVAGSTPTPTPAQAPTGHRHVRGNSIGGSAAPGAYDTRTQSATATTQAGYHPSARFESCTGNLSFKGSKPGNTAQDLGRGVQGVIGGVHGIGEVLRGEFNAALDKTFGHEAGAAKNRAIAQEGEREIQSANFHRRSEF